MNGASWTPGAHKTPESKKSDRHYPCMASLCSPTTPAHGCSATEDAASRARAPAFDIMPRVARPPRPVALRWTAQGSAYRAPTTPVLPPAPSESPPRHWAHTSPRHGPESPRPAPPQCPTGWSRSTRPGIRNLATAPTINPKMIHPMIPIRLSSLCSPLAVTPWPAQWA